MLKSKIATYPNFQELQFNVLIWANAAASLLNVPERLIFAGKSGGWKSQFTADQNIATDKWINDGLQGLDEIKFDYGDYAWILFL